MECQLIIRASVNGEVKVNGVCGWRRHETILMLCLAVKKKDPDPDKVGNAKAKWNEFVRVHVASCVDHLKVDRSTQKGQYISVVMPNVSPNLAAEIMFSHLPKSLFPRLTDCKLRGFRPACEECADQIVLPYRR